MNVLRLSTPSLILLVNFRAFALIAGCRSTKGTPETVQSRREIPPTVDSTRWSYSRSQEVATHTLAPLAVVRELVPVVEP
jgi:hypothetical protein